MKGKINFIIDALMFILLSAISGLGFLMKYVLIPGKDRIAKFGRSVDLYFLGLDRHEWGGIHLILGFFMLGLLVLHIVLHWQSIQCLFRRLVHAVRWRLPVVFGFSVISLFLFIFPFFVHIEIRDLKDGSHGHHHISGFQNLESPRGEMNHDFKTIPEMDTISSRLDASIQVHGRMTLTEVSEYYRIPVSTILSGLNIRRAVSPHIQMGHLRKQYGFRMSDVGHVIRQYRQTHSE